MSENPRVRQIAQAIWTFGYAERPEGVRKALRLLESIPSGPPFVPLPPFFSSALNDCFVIKYIQKNALRLSFDAIKSRELIQPAMNTNNILII